MYNKGSTLIESLFAFEIYCVVIVLLISLHNQLASQVAIAKTTYSIYTQERYEREKNICIEELSDLQELLR